MHEVDMTRALLLAMERWKEGHAPQQPQVGRVHLEVGAFTCVEPEQLRHTWGVAIRTTWLEGADLAIEPVALVGRCLGCQATYSPDAARGYRSPCCDHPMEEIVRGRELRIRSVDYHLPELPWAPEPLGLTPHRAAAAASASIPTFSTP